MVPKFVVDSREWVKCRECGRVLVGRVPKDGDGSFLFPSHHGSNGNGGLPCIGTYEEGEIVPAPVKR